MTIKSQKAALTFIFITLLIDVTGLGIIIPVMPKLITQLKHCTLSDAAKFGGWLSFVYAIMQFICAPILGNLSDRYGRRPILLFSLLGFGIDYIFQACATTIGWLFVGRIIAGITGASFTTASAFIADVSEPEKKAQNFGMIGAAFGMGFIIGPTIGGALGLLGPRVPFIAAAVLCLLNCLFGYFVMPESLSLENRRKFEWKRANPIGSLMQVRKYPAVAGLIAAIFMLYVAAHAVQSTWQYYNMYKFQWNELWVGASLAFVGLMIGLVQGLLIRKTIPMLGNVRSVYIGMSLYTVGMLFFGFAGNSWMMFAAIVPYCLGGIAGPAMQGILSNNVPANEQGELQGVMTSMMSVSAIIGPPMMTSLFAYYTSKQAPFIFPGAPFIAGAIIILFSTLLAVKSLKKQAVDA
jgi:DHA1 family tetracycline resistance protein-like MFS transporter